MLFQMEGRTCEQREEEQTTGCQDSCAHFPETAETPEEQWPVAMFSAVTPTTSGEPLAAGKKKKNPNSLG